MSRWQIVVVFAIALLAGGPATSVAAEADRELVAVGEFGGPVLEFDAHGHRHIVARTRIDGLDVGGDLWYATDRSGEWLAQRLLEGQGCEAAWTQASLAVGTDGSIHIAVADGRPCDTPSASNGLYYLTDQGRAAGDFGPATKVAGARREGPSLDVFDGVGFVAHARSSVPSDLPDPLNPLYLSTNRSGEWKTQRIADRGLHPSLKADADGRIHIVYSATDRSGDQGLWYVHSTKRGLGLTRPERIPRSGDDWTPPTLTLGPDGEPQVVWSKGEHLVWATRAGGAWSQPKRVGRNWEVSLDVDEAGRTHVLSERGQDGTRVISRHMLEDGTWSEEVLVEADAQGGLDGAVFGDELAAAWAPIVGFGLWATAAGMPSDPDVLARVAALDDLDRALSEVWGCDIFDERGSNDPFEFGAIAAISCSEGLGYKVRQLALFRFPDEAAMGEYWDWRLGQIEPSLEERPQACVEGKRGLTRWEHGEVACYVSSATGEAKLRFIDERTSTYGVVDAKDDDPARLHKRWTQLWPAEASR